MRHLTTKTTLLIIAISFFLYGNLHSQVKIGNNPATIDASSLLELESNDKGFLIPRMSTIERDAIFSPATVLHVYNTTTSLFDYYDGTIWRCISVRINHVLVQSSADFPAAVAGVITLDSTISYEINGLIIVSDKGMGDE
ncbi:MAG: hypothetical protein COA38_17440 [Fluviicola sp.]|nr:MAG: hypothetical protein COA38_17440 [Fluviicola sp.]